MYIPDILNQLKNNGLELKAKGDRLSYRPISGITPETLQIMRRYKHQLLVYLIRQQGESTFLYSNPPECHNPFTPHSDHKYPWECDPNSCYCYREYGYPRYCQGVPCRWVWGSSDKNEEQCPGK